jgi:hypothetical protein
MTENTKSFIKSTILGLLGGGAASAIYAMNNTGKGDKSESESDEITIPLSKRHFMKSVRGSRSGTKGPSDDAVPQVDAASMSPKDLAALKKALLRKKASDKCLKIGKTETVSRGEIPVRRIAGAGSTFPRDAKGRFVAEKDAGVVDTALSGVGKALKSVFGDTLSDAGGVMADSIGLIGGTAVGLAAVKAVGDRILVNKRKKQVEKARERYIESLSREVNDVDAPYYSKTAADRGFLGSALGLMGMAGLVTSTTAGIVMYRIMENRRKAIEKAKDKDLASYPKEKIIKFKFPNAGAEDLGFFE